MVREAKTLLAPIVIALILTFVLAPWVRALRQKGIPESLGAGIVVLALLSSTVPLGLASPAAEWLERAPTTVNQLLAQFDRLRASIPGFGSPPAPRTVYGLTASRSKKPAAPPADPVKERLASEGLALTSALVGRSLEFALAFAATVILLYFLLASEHWMLSRMMKALGRWRVRASVLGGLPSAQREIGQYLWTLSSINLAVGVVTGVAVAIVGSPNPTLWSVLAGFLNFVPYLGPMLMMILLLLAGLLSYKDLTPLLLPMLSFMLIHFIESTFISPGGVGRHLFLSTLAVFLSVMIWGWLWGIVGALIAVPMLIGLRSICRQVPRLSGWCLYMDGDTPPDTEETQPTKGSRTAHSWKFWGYHL